MSCKKCESLKNVPVDQKAISMLFDYSDISYDCNWFKGYMELNHNGDGSPYAFIKTEVTIESTGRSYDATEYIKYCPYCGEKLY